MTIHYIDPLSRAIARTKKDLFSPFDLKKWFVIGFTSFLAGLTDFGFSGLPSSSWRKGTNVEIEDVLYFPQRAWEWLSDNPGWAIAIGIGVFLIFVLGIFVTWFSSRGKFMLMDNVVKSKAEVVKPWYEYREEGNSFFLWNLVWGLAAFAVSIAYLIYCFLYIHNLYRGTHDPRTLIIPAVLAGIGFFFLSIAGGFIYLILKDFVVPIMYRDRITTSKAIQKFLPLFFSEFIHFVGYGLFMVCLGILIVISIVIVGCATCCVGFLILAVPYINAVILLPISFARRAFSLEFLEQFGPGFDIFPKPDVNPIGMQPQP